MADPEVVADASTPDTTPSKPVATQSLSPEGKLGGFLTDTSGLTGGDTKQSPKPATEDPSIASWLGLTPFGAPSALTSSAPGKEGKPVVTDEDMKTELDALKGRNSDFSRYVGDNATTQKNLYEKLGNLGAPPLPKLEDMPRTPRSELRSSFEVFRNPLLLAAVFGTLAMRGHAKTAMIAATGAMEGFNQGDKDRIKLEQERFKLNMERVKAQNDVALDRYRSIVENKKLMGQDYLNQIHGAAMELDHKIMANEAAKGNFQGTYDIWKALDANKTKITEAMLRRDSRLASQSAKDKKQAEADEAQKSKVDNFMTSLDAALSNVTRMKEAGGLPKVGAPAGVTKLFQETIPRAFGGEGNTEVSDLQRQLARLKDEYSQVMVKKGRLLSRELSNLDTIIPGSIKNPNISVTKGISMPNFTTLAETENALRELQARMQKLYPQIIKAEQEKAGGESGGGASDMSDEEIAAEMERRGLH